MYRIYIIIFFILLGLITTSKTTIKFFDKKPPYFFLFFYYLVLILAIQNLQKFGLKIGDTHFKDFRHTLGSILIIFSFFIVIKPESCYLNEVTGRKCDQENMSSIYISKEDGVVYYLFSKLTNNISLRRFLTYTLTPVVLTALGLVLIGKQKKINVQF